VFYYSTHAVTTMMRNYMMHFSLVSWFQKCR